MCKKKIYTEAYRSGHNGTDSKSVVPHGTVGSNPTASAKNRNSKRVAVLFLYCETQSITTKFAPFYTVVSFKIVSSNPSQPRLISS